MKESLPAELLEVLERSATADFVTIDGRGQPVGVAADAALHGGRGLHRRHGRPRAGRRRASRCSSPTPRRWSSCRARRTPRTRRGRSTSTCCPERVYVWPGGDLEAEPRLYDAHVDEVRSAHNEEPEVGHAPPEGGGSVWDERLDALGARHPDAVLAFVGPDGFPFAVRVPVAADREAGVVLVDADPVGAPIEPGLACLCADAPGRRGFHVLGDLDEDRGVWVLRPAPGRRPRARHARAADGRPDRRGHRPDGRDRPGLHPLAGALARRRAHRRDGAPALRPRGPRLEAHRVPPRRRARPRARSRGSSRAPTWSSTSRSSCSRPAARPATSTSRARATSSRPRSPPGAKRLVYSSSVAAYGFPEDLDGLITEDVPGARPRAPPVLRPQGRGRGGPRRRAERRRDRGVGLPPVHRRRARRARRSSTRRAGRIACPARWPRWPAPSASSPTRACPSSSSTTTTSPPRCAPASSGAASRAPTTSRPRARSR